MRSVNAGGILESPIVVIDEISVLGVQIEAVKVMIHDLPSQSLVDGVLGLSFLRHCDLRINFKEGILELH